MRIYDQARTADFFNTTFSDSQKAHIERNPDERLHPRDLILLERLFDKVVPAKGRMVDYACGHGRLLVEMLKRGFDCTGIEKHPGMHKVCVSELNAAGFPESRVVLGSTNALDAIEDSSIDVFIAMGLFQYLSEEEFNDVFAHAARVLTSGGHFIATFQNAFFDLFTFNKYTVDFLMNDLLAEGLPHGDAARAQNLVEELVTNPDKPSYAPDRARDNIFVRLSNPVTMPATLAAHQFSHKCTYYYEYFGLPPLLIGKAADIARAVKDKYEVVNAENWRGMFMANAFLCHAVRN